jgi:hypothetical protein
MTICILIATNFKEMSCLVAHQIYKMVLVKRHFRDFCLLVVDVNTRSFYTEKFRVMSSPVSECDTKNNDLSKLGSYRISDTAQYQFLLDTLTEISESM